MGHISINHMKSSLLHECTKLEGFPSRRGLILKVKPCRQNYRLSLAMLKSPQQAYGFANKVCGLISIHLIHNSGSLIVPYFSLNLYLWYPKTSYQILRHSFNDGKNYRRHCNFIPFPSIMSKISKLESNFKGLSSFSIHIIGNISPHQYNL